MHSSNEYLELAQARLNTASHILAVTYPTLHSPKLFLSVTEHLFLAMDYAMNAILLDQRSQEKIPPFNASFSSRYSNFRLKCAPALGFSKQHTEALQRCRNILLEHNQSPTVFERNSCLVICSVDYKMTILSEQSTSEILSYAKEFLAIAKKALEQSLSREQLSY